MALDMPLSYFLRNSFMQKQYKILKIKQLYLIYHLLPSYKHVLRLRSAAVIRKSSNMHEIVIVQSNWKLQLGGKKKERKGFEKQKTPKKICDREEIERITTLNPFVLVCQHLFMIPSAIQRTQNTAGLACMHPYAP